MCGDYCPQAARKRDTMPRDKCHSPVLTDEYLLIDGVLNLNRTGLPEMAKGQIDWEIWVLKAYLPSFNPCWAGLRLIVKMVL